MKILSAEVIDPRKEGIYRNPYLAIQVDEDVRATSEERSLAGVNGEWLVTKHGPFLAIDWLTFDCAIAGSKRDPGDLGIFNATGLMRTKLVDIVAVSTDEETDLAISLERARRLVRQHEPTWRYVLDDLAGQKGLLTWRLVTPYQRCVKCNRPVVDELFYRGTYMPLCEEHRGEHNKLIASKRSQSA